MKTGILYLIPERNSWNFLDGFGFVYGDELAFLCLCSNLLLNQGTIQK